MSEESTTPAVQYKPVEGFPGYRVGDDGSVWSCWRRVRLGPKEGGRGVIGTQWKRLKGGLREGYPKVMLCRDGKPYNRACHNLVLEAFVGPCPEGMEAAHEDGNRLNAALSNLSYKTPQDNQQDKKRHGTYLCGERITNSKLKEEQVRAIRREYSPRRGVIAALARKYGVAEITVSHIIKRRTWAHLD